MARVWIFTRTSLNRMTVPPGIVLYWRYEQAGRIRRRLRRAEIVKVSQQDFCDILPTFQWLGRTGDAACDLEAFPRQIEAVHPEDTVLVFPVGRVTGHPRIEYWWAEEVSRRSR